MKNKFIAEDNKKISRKGTETEAIFFEENNKNSPIFVGILEPKVTSAAKLHYKIGTSGLNSCLGIALYDEQEKVGGVAHIFFPDIKTKSDLANINIEITNLLTQTNVAGGQKYKLLIFNINNNEYRSFEQNELLISEIKNIIEQLEKDNIITQFEFRDDTGFYLNTRNGEIHPVISF